ncbi:MAG: amino acid ABC transporter substrate-binding protein [Desulfobulbaceae bacterium]|nr:MAG: amino acid ABC transporter substrate-binding protein [Desulfobulbaceae bacterium]
MSRLFRVLVYLGSIIVGITGGSCLAAGTTITLVADEWPPFNGKPGSGHEGYIVDIARRVFESRGCRVIYKLVPWMRAIEMTRSGEYDGAIGASKTDAAGFVFPREELAQNKLAFYVRKGSAWRFRGPASIEEATIGTIAGYDYRSWLLAYIEANRDNPAKVQVLHGEEPLKRNLTKLMNGRIGVVVDTEAAIRFVANEMNILDQIECAGYGDEPAFIYIAFSPNSPESGRYAELLSQGIVAMRKSGELQKILDKYGLKDWK